MAGKKEYSVSAPGNEIASRIEKELASQRSAEEASHGQIIDALVQASRVYGVYNADSEVTAEGSVDFESGEVSLSLSRGGEEREEDSGEEEEEVREDNPLTPSQRIERFKQEQAAKQREESQQDQD